MDARDPERAAGQQGRGEAPERRDDAGLDELELPVEVWLARRDLGGQRIAVARRAALEHGCEVRVVEREPDGPEQPLEQLARTPGERPAVAVLVEARRLAHEDEIRVGVPLAEDDLRAPLGERAADATGRLAGRLAECTCARRRIHR